MLVTFPDPLRISPPPATLASTVPPDWLSNARAAIPNISGPLDHIVCVSQYEAVAIDESRPSAVGLWRTQSHRAARALQRCIPGQGQMRVLVPFPPFSWKLPLLLIVPRMLVVVLKSLI